MDQQDEYTISSIYRDEWGTKEQDFAYIAMIALLVLEGKASLSPLRDIGDGGSYQAMLMPLADNHIKLSVYTKENFNYLECKPDQMIEALTIKLTELNNDL